MFEELLKQQATIAVLGTILLGVVKAALVRVGDEDSKAFMPAITLVLMVGATYLVSEVRDLNADVFDVITLGALTAGTPTLLYEGQKQIRRIAPSHVGGKR